MPNGPRFDDILPAITKEDIALMGDELTQLKQLLGGGEALALAGGPILAWWGVVLFLADMYRIGVLVGALPKYTSFSIPELIIGYLGTVIINRLRGKNRLFVSWRTQAISTVWIFAGLGIIIYNIGSKISGHEDAVLENVFLATIFALVTAVMSTSSRKGWLLIPSVGWLGVAIGMFMIGQDMWRFALFGMASLLFICVPGLRLLISERQSHEAV